MGSEQYVVLLETLDRSQIAEVGGKAAQLGELSRIAGVRVPPGFVVTTAAPAADPVEVEEQVRGAVVDGVAYAVRSSATAEDLPTASFAGQHDSFLDVVGPDAVLEQVRRCWDSLTTERAVSYRAQAGVADARMAVVVQEQVPAVAAGVLFTADPLTGHRRVSAVEAVAGLGDQLVSGCTTPDSHTVRDGEILTRATAGENPVLSDAQLFELERLGRRVAAHFGSPQDIEWCLAAEGFALVQARPITTLFPVPVADDDAPHVYVSVGHQQMMTDAMKPLGLSMWQMKALPVMHEAGGRLFVDIADRLAAPASRQTLVQTLGDHDPLIGGALAQLLERDGFLASLAEPAAAPPATRGARGAVGTETADVSPELVAELIARSEQAADAAERTLSALSGPAVFEAIRSDIQELKGGQLFHPDSHRVIMVAMEAAWWLNEHLETWLGEKNAADTLSQSVTGNVTSEMGLELLDVADVIRPHPEVVAYLEDVQDDAFVDGLADLPGGPDVRDALREFLDRHGMRCAGEIDITRPRWSERPSTLVPVLLGNVRNAEPGEGARRFEDGRLDAWVQEQELIERLRALPDGERKAGETKERIDLVRAYSGYREYPKYGIVRRSFVYKQALLREADRLVGEGVVDAADDVFFLTFDEFEEAAATRAADRDLIAERRRTFARHEALTPPRVMTSDGEIVSGAYPGDGAPEGALLGLPVSGGTVEGRARVVLDIGAAELERGDILVTTFTDPSWTPLFLGIEGLVTEVGGQMTHGAVIAREYGLPAVVGVLDATRLIPDGARIRVHGTDGFVEVLA